MPKTTRTFIAIVIPPALGGKLSRLQDDLAPAFPGTRWTSNTAFHTTLAFLGDVLDVDLNKVCRTVVEACAPFAPLQLDLRGVGVFPGSARPRVIWAGLSAADLSPLQELQRSVVQAVTAAGYRPDDQRFTPHVTLGRIRQDRRSPPPLDLAPALEARRNWSGGSFRVTEVVVYSSSLDPEGPVYTPLARAPLACKKGGASP